MPSKVKQSNGTFCIQVREISCYLLLIIKSLNNMEETTSRWIQITVIPFLSKKCTFGTERVSVLIDLSVLQGVEDDWAEETQELILVACFKELSVL